MLATIQASTLGPAEKESAFPFFSDMNSAQKKWRFPKIRGTCLGVLIIRTIILWGHNTLGSILQFPLFTETTKCKIGTSRNEGVLGTGSSVAQLLGHLKSGFNAQSL